MKQILVHNMRVATALALVALAAACSDSSRDPAGVNGGSTAAAAAATSMQATAGDNQTAMAGSALSVTPSVLITDGKGAPVSGVAVTFTVTGGGGFVQSPSAVTSAQGIASPGKWTLGAIAGTNVLEATSGTLTAVRFTATATPNPVTAYNITIRWVATATTTQQQAVANAVARWQSVITKDLYDIPVNAAANACFTGQPAINERIDDILIYVEFVNIDGPGQVLGEAGPCFIRSDNSLPVIGHLKLDAADLALMERSGTLDDVVLHEMGHILGIGTLWPDKSLLLGAGSTDPRFTGVNAIGAYHALGGTDTNIAVENIGSDGTRDGHWRESVFGNELMTGYISSGGNPMSTMTIASLTDLGYGTNSGAAGGYTLSKTGSGGIVFDMHQHEQVQHPKYKIDRGGNKTKLRD